jgi:hypothetical protein
MTEKSEGINKPDKPDYPAFDDSKDINDRFLFSVLSADIKDVRTEIRDVRTELIKRTDQLSVEIKGVRTELKTDIESVRTELRADIKDVRAGFSSIRKTIGYYGAAFIFGFLGIIGSLIGLFLK